MTSNISYSVWTEPMKRAKARVVAADIKAALAVYLEVTGADPKVIGLNPRNGALPIPTGIELRLLGGCSAGEVWLSDGLPYRQPGYFDAARDVRLCNAGTHFFCSGCLVARPLAEKSSEPRYCNSCFGLMSAEKAVADTTGRFACIQVGVQVRQSPKVGGNYHQTTKCVICDKEFTSKRSDALFCSPKCRQQSSRESRQLVLGVVS